MAGWLPVALCLYRLPIFIDTGHPSLAFLNALVRSGRGGTFEQLYPERIALDTLSRHDGQGCRKVAWPPEKTRHTWTKTSGLWPTRAGWDSRSNMSRLFVVRRASTSLHAAAVAVPPLNTADHNRTFLLPASGMNCQRKLLQSVWENAIILLTFCDWTTVCSLLRNGPICI